jgi:hypothetical protein
VQLKALRNSLGEFEEIFGGFEALYEMFRDKIFFVMSNMYFFNQSREMHMDFNVAFHPVLVPSFADVFPIRVVATQYGEYLAEESGLDI